MYIIVYSHFRRIPGLSFESKDVAIPLKRLQEKTLDVEPIKKLMAPYLQQFKDRGWFACLILGLFTCGVELFLIVDHFVAF